MDNEERELAKSEGLENGIGVDARKKRARLESYIHRNSRLGRKHFTSSSASLDAL